MRPRITAMAVGVTLLLAACSGGSGNEPTAGAGAAAAANDTEVATEGSGAPAVLARPAALASLPEVELIAPGESDAGVAPTFEWEAFDGAVAYRLSVLGPQRPLWSWTGDDTKVTLGLREPDRSEYAPGLEIVQGSWWSVSALAADGSVLALSAFRAVSPGDAPEEPAAPEFMSTGLQPAEAEPEPEAEQRASDGTLPDACEVVSAEEVASAFGDVADFGPSGFPTGEGTDCTFERIDDGLTIDITLQPNTDDYRPEDWVRGEPTPVDGLGDESYFVNDGLSVKVGWIHGEYSAHVWAYAGSEQGIIDLAKLVDSRLP